MTDNPNLSQFLDRLEKLSDETRTEAKNKRHKLGLRTARENLDHLVDDQSFLEYGAFAVAAQRNRRKYEDLQIDTAADGIITGFVKSILILLVRKSLMRSVLFTTIQYWLVLKVFFII